MRWLNKVRNDGLNDKIDKMMSEKLNKILKIRIDTESLDKMDISFIESYIRKKKLEIINKNN